ncbi:MAG: hypothetical protein Ct9H300mP20_07240 [Gammaproteobacteria bacterium]|nr:MAG: hypothetical protein Ct9H300mP20_07240 [Gammaproteobacteria bacterium]
MGPYSNMREEVFFEWQESIAELAERDNVYIKIGGLAMPIKGLGGGIRENCLLTQMSLLKVMEGITYMQLNFSEQKGVCLKATFQ